VISNPLVLEEENIRLRESRRNAWYMADYRREKVFCNAVEEKLSQ